MKETFELPDEITPSIGKDPRDLVLIGIPKIGKGTILGSLTEKANAIVFDLEKGGYEYISARKVSTYTDNETTEWESFKNYIKYRNLLLENKGKYKYLIIDGLSDLDSLSVLGGTLSYMDTVIGKNFNRDAAGNKYLPGDPEWKDVLTLPDGAGYQHTRKWFLLQIEIFRQISPYRLYAAHIVDKYIKDNGKEEVIGGEIALTGQLKRIFAAKVTALCKIIAEDNLRYLNFDVQNDSIVAGSRSSALTGKILISSVDPETKKATTFWESIYDFEEENNIIDKKK